MNEHLGLGFVGPVGVEWEGVEKYLPRPYKDGWAGVPGPPIAIDPPLVAQRMLVQHSHFTLHGRDEQPLEEMQHLKKGLVKVVIDLEKDDLEHMLWQLRLCGIMETTVFPDLEGLARDLGQEYDLG